MSLSFAICILVPTIHADANSQLSYAQFTISELNLLAFWCGRQDGYEACDTTRDVLWQQGVGEMDL